MKNVFFLLSLFIDDHFVCFVDRKLCWFSKFFFCFRHCLVQTTINEFNRVCVCLIHFFSTILFYMSHSIFVGVEMKWNEKSKTMKCVCARLSRVFHKKKQNKTKKFVKVKRFVWIFFRSECGLLKSINPNFFLWSTFSDVMVVIWN